LSINGILREYRKTQIIERVSESEAAKLLHPAIRFFNAHFSSAGNGIIEFGLDILFAQKLFYQGGLFDRYIHGEQSENLPLYTDVKLKLKSLM
ncbi:hypothetical protein Q0P57_13740, partial [Staphylococcus aureus]|nr:hypothetical protein [Staphylococcus aureus]